MRRNARGRVTTIVEPAMGDFLGGAKSCADADRRGEGRGLQAASSTLLRRSRSGSGRWWTSPTSTMPSARTLPASLRWSPSTRDRPSAACCSHASEPPSYDIGWLVVTANRRSEGIGEALVGRRGPRLGAVPRGAERRYLRCRSPRRGSRRFYTRLGFVPAETVEQGPEGGSRQRFELRLAQMPQWAI